MRHPASCAVRARRDVALKILLETFAHDSDRIARELFDLLARHVLPQLAG